MRSTVIFQALLKIFQRAERPINVKEALALLKKIKIFPNKTTIYRLLEKLENKDIISKLRIGDNSFSYELANSHHHHVICKKCDKIEDVILASDLSKEERNIAQKTNFSSIRHNLEFYGICSNCRN
jgi:Fe2+ or Zn2+ uptake regulation protein